MVANVAARPVRFLQSEGVSCEKYIRKEEI